MKRYKARIRITEYYDVLLDAQDDDDAYDTAEELDPCDIKDGDLIFDDIEAEYVEEVT